MNPWRPLAVLALLGLVGGLVYWSAHAGIPPVVSAPAPAPISTPSVTPAAPALPVRPNLGSSTFRQISLQALTQAVPVYTYHDIIRSRSQKGAVWFDCTLAEFEEQMRFLKAHGAHPVTLAQLQTHLTTGARLPDHAVALTFDDGYQGFYDLAYPVLKRYGYPAAMFVHTDYVGVQTGDHPKMTWAEVLQLDREGLVTIGAHTRSHPADLALLSVAQQDEELRGSKAVLEGRLGHVVNFQSYANGKGDDVTFQRARLAGYTLSFLEFWGPVEQSPDIMQLGRYIHIQMQRGWDEAYGPDALPTAVRLPLSDVPPTSARERGAGVRFTVLRGGPLSLQVHPQRVTLRQGLDRVAGPATMVLQLASDTPGSGEAAGPVYDPVNGFRPVQDLEALKAAGGRPMVLWSERQLAILPFASGLMNEAPALKSYLPGLHGAFLAEVWLVHRGKALSPAALATSALGQSPVIGAQRARLRSFLGITPSGVPVMGVSLTPVTVLGLTRALEQLGLQEAVLVASGPSAVVATGRTDTAETKAD